jgi:hypothetical protein
MHHKTREAAVKRMKEANPHITDAEILIELNKMEPGPKIDDEIGEATKAIAGETYPSGRVSPPGKKLYDKWRGQWKAVQKVKNPFGNEEKIVKWQFEYLESKPNRTGIPLTVGEAEIFNNTRKMPVAGVPTEQVAIHGTKPDIFYDLTAEFQPVAM